MSGRKPCLLTSVWGAYTLRCVLPARHSGDCYADTLETPSTAGADDEV